MRAPNSDLRFGESTPNLQRPTSKMIRALAVAVMVVVGCGSVAASASQEALEPAAAAQEIASRLQRDDVAGA